MASRIEDYGLLANTRTAALVSRQGSIDWWCAPDFDSDACLSSLIGYDEHGRWSIRPTVAAREIVQRYRGDTMVLETEWRCDGGAVRVTDFMPPTETRCDIVRIIEGLEGTVPMEMVLNPRFGFGADRPWIRRGADGLLLTAGPDALIVRSSIAQTNVIGDNVTSLFEVTKGSRLRLQLSWFASHHQAPPALDVDRELERTLSYWGDWAERLDYRGKYREAVMRSLLTLRALTYAPTGAVVAAPTTSLPEELGGVRNWDYRFCWLRDASLTLLALMFGGYVDEANRFRDWLMRAVSGDPSQTQIMYSIRGGRRLTEYEASWLPGYESSRPVHIGNAAFDQFQLDIYGEVLACLYLGRRLGLGEVEGGWETGRSLIRHVMEVWQHPDDGVWEVRGGRRQFVYSKIMAWAAVDRAIRSIDEFAVGGEEGREMLPHLRALRERMHEEICARGYNPKVNAFTQSYGSEALDASVLLMPHLGFLPADDPRVVGTVAAVEKHLMRDGFVLRYSTETGADGLPGSEGAFLACSFWLADNYAFAGRREDAEALYDRLLGLRNHLGLLAEEYEPRVGRLIGNFPQGFSHLALVTTARILATDEASRAKMEPAMVTEPEAAGAAP